MNQDGADLASQKMQNLAKKSRANAALANGASIGATAAPRWRNG
jgi:hypothetical protein